MIKQSLLALAMLLAPAAHAQVRVEASGSTIEEAKQRAFESAVQQGAGVLILKETEAVNREIVRNEILAYSSGFVEKFQIKKQWVEDGKIRLIMDIWVSDSKIADRIKTVSRDGKNIDGRQFEARSQTLAQEQVSGDKIFKMIIKDYPAKAIEVKIVNVSASGKNNKTSLHVEAVVEWSEGFLISLADALEKTSLDYKQDYETAISVRTKGFSWSSPSTGTYADDSKLKILRNRLTQDQLAIKVLYHNNSAKKPFAESCTDIPFYFDGSPYFGTRKQEYSLFEHFAGNVKWPDLHFNGNYSEKIRFGVDLIEPLANTDRVTAGIVFRKDCI